MGANPLKSKKRSATSLLPSLPLYLDEDLDSKSIYEALTAAGATVSAIGIISLKAKKTMYGFLPLPQTAGLS